MSLSVGRAPAKLARPEATKRPTSGRYCAPFGAVATRRRQRAAETLHLHPSGRSLSLSLYFGPVHLARWQQSGSLRLPRRKATNMENRHLAAPVV